MELVVTTGAIRRAKLQSNQCHKQTNTQRFTGRMPFMSPNQQCKSPYEDFSCLRKKTVACLIYNFNKVN